MRAIAPIIRAGGAMKDTLDVEPGICSCAALREAARHVTRFYDEALAPVGLGLNQYAILARLARVGPKTLQELADLLVMDRSTLGRLLRPLEERELLAIEISAADRRHRVISLTRRGRAEMSRADPLWARAERRFVTMFGADDARALRQTLKRITEMNFTQSQTERAR
jgi:DNA-binding MarR family transcriptional regulator